MGFGCVSLPPLTPRPCVVPAVCGCVVSHLSFPASTDSTAFCGCSDLQMGAAMTPASNISMTLRGCTSVFFGVLQHFHGRIAVVETRNHNACTMVRLIRPNQVTTTLAWLCPTCVGQRMSARQLPFAPHQCFATGRWLPLLTLHTLLALVVVPSGSQSMWCCV